MKKTAPIDVTPNVYSSIFKKGGIRAILVKIEKKVRK